MGRALDEFRTEDLREALSSAQVGVWLWDIGTERLSWSEVTYAIFEMSPKELAGSFDAFLSRVHPDDRDSLTHAVQTAVEATRQDFAAEHRLLFPDGRVKWVEGRGRVMVSPTGEPNRMIGTVVDVTARKEAEQRLRVNEERFRLFTNHATDYVYDAAISGTVAVPEIVAGSFERVTRLTPDKVAELGGWSAVMHPDDRERTMALLDELSQGRSVLHEYRIIDGEGRVRWLRDRVVPVLDDDGALVKLVGGVTDITEQRALEERLIEAQRMEALARMAAGVAHDFNNLLTVLMAEVALLRLPRVTGQLRDAHLDQIDATLERASHLTSSLLAFGRSTAGPVEVIDVGEAVERSLPILARAGGESVEVVVVARGADARVMANPSDIDLVLLNLTLNARDAMPAGGRVDIGIETMTLSTADASRPPELAPGDYVLLWVRDQGEGITPEIAAHIFEPYFTTKGHVGTGLGLPTCVGIVQRYGGILRLRETSREGSVFEMLLPASDRPVSTPGMATSATMVGGRETVLVVDDEPSVLDVTARMLREHGYTVLEAASAEAALAMELPALDALLTDVRLPGESGLALARALRTAHTSLAVLVMSGHVADPDQQRLAEGEFAFIAKPFSLQGLLLRLREALNERRS
jgi:two-component system, cell cycle sensor histidine kinase and response regulator CckA